MNRQHSQAGREKHGCGLHISSRGTEDDSSPSRRIYPSPVNQIVSRRQRRLQEKQS